MKIRLHDDEVSEVMSELAVENMPGVRVVEWRDGFKEVSEEKPRPMVKSKTRSAFLEEALREWDVAMGWDLEDTTMVPSK